MEFIDALAAGAPPSLVRIFQNFGAYAVTTLSLKLSHEVFDCVINSAARDIGPCLSANSAAPAGEMDSTEVIYLPTASGPMPIATQINGRLYAIDSDHLNTPRRLTNSQGQVAWE